MDREIRDLESLAPRIRELDRIEFETVKVGYAITSETHQVMVMVGVAIEPGHRVRMICSAHDAELYQRFKCSINRRPRNPWNAASDLFKELIRGGMIFAVQHGLEDNSPLYRLWQTLLATEFLELSDLLLFEC